MNASVLGNKAIKKFLEEGEIIIEPFNIKNLNTSSYDVTLGNWFFREQHRDQWESHIYNMYSEENVKRIWGKPQEAKPYKFYKEKGIFLENIKEDDCVIFIDPGETILAHTNEWIGTRTHITTMMKSRSSLGRNFIETCKCAGFGDVGYHNRWTLEITNNSTKYTIPLVVGRRLAQIVFMDVGEIDDQKNNYNKTGKYQTQQTLEDLQKNWTPYDMLPKMYLDFENFVDK
ncbi:deoxycytidine triphosphate deaminase [Fadolivirus algeromassiliense]|jgi:dCTP deaminase|uniref:dUTP diphosphatase n=1 Tax=Fadolivirus FV1/VV64 TaxID=3070911 RepID=A0A7D3UQL0_9VIRU|nr:deoxycytidine triphosphate deaminase [Fadolivirus algeromassiliense]QKF94508.1 deoxycytidine triphosphate deaminase [Fadolivirus FV1/VV64]